MFPYVCLATMSLFCSADWPRRLRLYFSWKREILLTNVNLIANSVKETNSQIKESPSADCSTLPSNEILHNKTPHKGIDNQSYI